MKFSTITVILLYIAISLGILSIATSLGILSAATMTTETYRIASSRIFGEFKECMLK